MFYFSRAIHRNELLLAVEKASESLGSILDDNDISFVLVDNKKSAPFHDYKNQWGDAGTFRWKKTFKKFSAPDGVITLALYSDGTLCGLCELSVMRSFVFRRRSMEINALEGKPTNNPLKGYIIAAFSHAALSIAKDFNFSSISIFKPDKETLPSYFRAGFQIYSGITKRAYKFVKSNTELNWASIFTEQRKKERYVPKYFLSLATP